MNIAGVGFVVDKGLKHVLNQRYHDSKKDIFPQVEKRNDSRLAVLEHEIRGLKCQMIEDINAAWKRGDTGDLGPTVADIMTDYKRAVEGKVHLEIIRFKMEVHDAVKAAEQERQEKQEAIQRAHQERERADALQRQLDELLGARIAGKKRTGSEMEGSGEK